MNIENIQKCPNCDNIVIFDKQQSLTYCKNKKCQGLIIEFGNITYEQEVNLHENEDQKQKQTRFGGYESKKDTFINQLQVALNVSDSKARDRLYKKFDQGEHLIHKLAGDFQINEATVKEILMKYRDLLLTHMNDKLQNKSFDQVAVVAFNLVAAEKRKKEWLNNPSLSKLTSEIICDFADQSMENVQKLTKKLGLNHDKAYLKQQELEELLKSSKEFAFNDQELEVIKKFQDNLMHSSLIKGEKSSTINSITQICIAQLSLNPQLNATLLEEFAQKNNVTKETIKRMWNQIVDKLQIACVELLPNTWTSRRPLSDLHSIA